VEGITEDIQGGLRRNRSTTNQTFCILLIPEIHGKVDQLFIDHKRAYNIFRREVLHNILNEFLITMKGVWLIVMCLNETDKKVHRGKHLFDEFSIQNDTRQGVIYRYCISNLF
jgi:hypothetical protein